MFEVIIKPAGFGCTMTITIRTRHIVRESEYDSENDAFIDTIETDHARIVTINKFLTTIEPKGEYAYAIPSIKVESDDITVKEVNDE